MAKLEMTAEVLVHEADVDGGTWRKQDKERSCVTVFWTIEAYFHKWSDNQHVSD